MWGWAERASVKSNVPPRTPRMYPKTVSNYISHVQSGNRANPYDMGDPRGGHLLRRVPSKSASLASQRRPHAWLVQPQLCKTLQTFSCPSAAADITRNAYCQHHQHQHHQHGMVPTSSALPASLPFGPLCLLVPGAKKLLERQSQTVRSLRTGKFMVRIGDLEASGCKLQISSHQSKPTTQGLLKTSLLRKSN